MASAWDKQQHHSQQTRRRSASTRERMMETRAPQPRVLARAQSNTKLIHSDGKAKGDGRGDP